MEPAIGYIIFSVITLIGIIIPNAIDQPTPPPRVKDTVATSEEVVLKKTEPMVTSSLMEGIETTRHPVKVGEIDEKDLPTDEGMTSGDISKSKSSTHPTDFIPPVKDIRLISSFGTRIHPISKKKKFHTGIDLDGERGDPILAIADGTVSFAGRKNGYGKVVELDHANHWKSVYAHLERIEVQIDQSVKKGTLIAKMGNSGQSTGVHLHFELHQNQKVVDPAKTIDFQLGVGQ